MCDVTPSKLPAVVTPPREVMAERDEARRVWAATHSVADRKVYRRLRNRAKLLLSRARRAHLSESLHCDTRRFWSRFKAVWC